MATTLRYYVDACLLRHDDLDVVVYVLNCKDGSFYIGFTGNIKKRLYQHRKGLVCWTRSRLPVELIHQESFSQRLDAVEREKNLKTGFGRKWLKRCFMSRRRQVFPEDLEEAAEMLAEK